MKLPRVLTEENREVDVVVIENAMKRIFLLTLLFSGLCATAQTDNSGDNAYKKRVLETPEVEMLMSLYNQQGDHSAVGGGVGDEAITDGTTSIVVTLPLSDDDVLTIDAGLSAYTSASSSNINPFHNSGASSGSGDDDDDDDFARSGASRGSARNPVSVPGETTGTPWLATSGASRHDMLKSISLDYSHSSDSRNFIWGVHGAATKEFDYHSFGFGGSVAGLFFEKNTEINLKTQVYLDQWKPVYPTELHEYLTYGNNFLSQGYFNGVTVINESGNATTAYRPDLFSAWTNKNRNSYSATLTLSQIISKRLQASVFFDVIYQEGLLSTPYHRIYFADLPNYYIGTASDISHYTTRQNTGVYQLADNVEHLPGTRFKTPFGARVNYYVSEFLKVRTYYRYYTDDWGIASHTGSIELPVSLSQSITLSPTFRYSEQTAATYFAPYETHLSTEKYFTSDYDLAALHSTQWGMAFNYTDIFSERKLFKMGLKNIGLRFSHYGRSDGLKANIISFSIKCAVE